MFLFFSLFSARYLSSSASKTSMASRRRDRDRGSRDVSVDVFSMVFKRFTNWLGVVFVPEAVVIDGCAGMLYH